MEISVYIWTNCIMYRHCDVAQGIKYTNGQANGLVSHIWSFSTILETSHSAIHTNTHFFLCLSAFYPTSTLQWTHWQQLWLQYLGQGYIGMQTGAANQQPPIGRWHALPSEPRLSNNIFLKLAHHWHSAFSKRSRLLLIKWKICLWWSITWSLYLNLIKSWSIVQLEWWVPIKKTFGIFGNNPKWWSFWCLLSSCHGVQVWLNSAQYCRRNKLIGPSTLWAAKYKNCSLRHYAVQFLAEINVESAAWLKRLKTQCYWRFIRCFYASGPSKGKKI